MLRSLSVRLFIWIVGIIIVGFAIFAYLLFRRTSQQWIHTTNQSASRTSAVIERAIRHGMLLNRMDDVHNTLRRIANGPGVAGIRIYDKEGKIIFSAEEKEKGKRVDLKAEACIICHDRDKPLAAVPKKRRYRVFRDASGQRILGLIHPIRNSQRCADARCHAHPPDQKVLGVLDVRISMDFIDRARRKAKHQTIVATLVMALAGGLAAALFIHRMVTVPAKSLFNGIRRISSGNLDTHIDVASKDEIGELARAFNKMTDDLALAHKENREWSEQLEQKVAEKTEELRRAQRQIVHMEKMASLGKLAATVAHELNNPLAGILVYAKLVARDLKQDSLSKDEREELKRYLTLIEQESSRCGNIVRNLLHFARRSKAVFREQHLNQIVDRSVMLIRHHLELVDISLELILLEGDDALVCDAGQLQQAVVALLVNAIEAMTEGGKLRVCLSADKESVQIEISDTGTGIPADVLPNIFEPFFSTKEGEKGAGLGLAVAYGIVHRHGGDIQVESKPGAGTTFVVTVERRPQPPDDNGDEVGPGDPDKAAA